jgi:hypothetical protein
MSPSGTFVTTCPSTCLKFSIGRRAHLSHRNRPQHSLPRNQYIIGVGCKNASDCILNKILKLKKLLADEDPFETPHLAFRNAPPTLVEGPFRSTLERIRVNRWTNITVPMPELWSAPPSISRCLAELSSQLSFFSLKSVTHCLYLAHFAFRFKFRISLGRE